MPSSATSTSRLYTDATNGLQFTLQRCPTAWSETGPAPNYTYTCSATPTEVLPLRPVSTSAQALTGMQSAVAGGTDHLLLIEKLSPTADNTFQNLSIDLTFTIDAA